MLDLTNPVHRVNEIHSSQSTLQSGFEAIEQHAAFQKQSGVLFKELTDLVKRSGSRRTSRQSAVRDCVAPDRLSGRPSAASFADKDVWNSLQSHKNQALLELTPLLDGWRAEARTIITQALDRLPGDLSERSLDGALQSSLSEPLVQLRRQPGRCHHAGTGRRIPRPCPATRPQPGTANRRGSREEAASRTQGRREAGHSALPQPRQVRFVRATEVASVTRVSTEQEWVRLNAKLDQRVRQLLAEGFDVELA